MDKKRLQELAGIVSEAAEKDLEDADYNFIANSKNKPLATKSTGLDSSDGPTEFIYYFFNKN